MEVENDSVMLQFKIHLTTNQIIIHSDKNVIRVNLVDLISVLILYFLSYWVVLISHRKKLLCRLETWCKGKYIYLEVFLGSIEEHSSESPLR